MFNFGLSLGKSSQRTCDIERNALKEWLSDVIYKSEFQKLFKHFSYSKIYFSDSWKDAFTLNITLFEDDFFAS